ncbi:MAG TPA: hypothetical protein PLY70_13970, partial [Saprospiraceae bacterium]|nr:hypothetical protein [Saprospiraceae bacterium]
AQLICFALANTARMIYLRNKEGLNPFEGNGRVFIFTILGIALAIYFHYYLTIEIQTNAFLTICIIGLKSVFISTIALGLMYYFKLSSELNSMIDKQLFSRFNK